MSEMSNANIYIRLSTWTLTMISFVMLCLATFSTPISTDLYFLRTSRAQGVIFGAWGWCLEKDATCTSPRLGYTWGTQIDAPITGSLVLYPIATILNFFLLVSLVPAMRVEDIMANRISSVLAIASFTISSMAFIFMLVVFEPARRMFAAHGYTAQFGPSFWLSLVSIILQAVVMGLTLRPTLFKELKEPQWEASFCDKESHLTSPPYRRRLRPIMLKPASPSRC